MSTITAILYLLGGAGLGTLYFLALDRAVRLHVGGAGRLPLIALSLLRLAGAATALWWVAQAGAAALLLTLAGFLVARTGVQRHVYRR